MCKVDVMMSFVSNGAGFSNFDDVSSDVSHELLVKKGIMTMTLEEVLHEYRTWATQATELRTMLKRIKEQLTRGGTADWVHRAKRAYDFKAQQLRQVKEELKAYRALLRNIELEN
jgi:hypothetical protein